MNRINDLLHTIEVCRRLLPADAHPDHYERLRDIERIVRLHAQVTARATRVIDEGEGGYRIVETEAGAWDVRAGRW